MYDIAPKNKNAVEIDSLQAYFQFSSKFYKNCCVWFFQANWFRNHKITFRDPIWGYDP